MTTTPARLSPGRNQKKASVVLCMEAESSASTVQSMKVYYETRALADD